MCFNCVTTNSENSALCHMALFPGRWCCELLRLVSRKCRQSRTRYSPSSCAAAAGNKRRACSGLWSSALVFVPCFVLKQIVCEPVQDYITITLFEGPQIKCLVAGWDHKSSEAGVTLMLSLNPGQPTSQASLQRQEDLGWAFQRQCWYSWQC